MLTIIRQIQDQRRIDRFIPALHERPGGKVRRDKQPGQTAAANELGATCVESRLMEPHVTPQRVQKRPHCGKTERFLADSWRKNGHGTVV